MGAIAHVVAADPADSARILASLLAQKQAQADAGGSPNAYASPEACAFLQRLCEARDGRPAPLELHALTLDGRPVAAFGALSDRQRLCGLLLSRDTDPNIARCGPGRLLLHQVIASAIARGFVRFDLGLGEARHKEQFCEVVEPMFDGFIPVTLRGRSAAMLLRAVRTAKGRIKRSPRLMVWAKRLRQRIG